MAKGKLITRQREKVADKLMQLGNIVFSGMIIAPLVSSEVRGAHMLIAAGGAIIFAVLYVVAVKIMRGGGKD